MAFSQNTTWEVQQAGSDTNGGGFVTGVGGTDYTQIATKRPNGGVDGSSVLAVANGTTTITCSDAQFGTTVVGSTIYFAGGTGSIVGCWRQVTAWISSTSITIDALIAASTGMTMNIGGALASPGLASAMAIIHNFIFVKYSATPFSITSATGNVAGGCVVLTIGVDIYGYATTRTIGNTDALRPTLLASGITVATIISSGSNSCNIYNLIVDGASLTSLRGFSGSIGSNFANCRAQNCTNNGFFNIGFAFKCVATGCTLQAAFNGNGMLLLCEAISNVGVVGFAVASNYGATVCISTGNAIGYQSQGRSVCLQGCIAYGNTSHGFDGAVQAASNYFGCIAESNGGFGFSGIEIWNMYRQCATYSNTSGALNGTVNSPPNSVILNTTGTFFTNAAGSDFSTNNLTGQGALLRAAFASLNSYSVSATVGYRDVGAVQHADPVGGASIHGSVG